MKLKHTFLLIALFALSITGCTNGHGQGGGTNSSGTGGEDVPPVPPDPTTETYNQENSVAKAVSISTLVSKKASDTSNLYRITGIAQYPNNTTYGNFDLLDDTGYIYVYGASKNASSISMGSTITFTNDKSWSQMSIKPGDTVTIEGIYVWYSYGKSTTKGSSYGVPEFEGYVTKVIHNNQSTITPKSYTAAETYSGNYYSGIDTSATGSTLLTALHNKMVDTNKHSVSYNGLTNAYKESDPGTSSGQVKCFYSGKSTSTSSVNREHVWPQSLSGSTSNSSTNLYGETGGGCDLHHLRPTINSYNSTRSSSAFGPIYGSGKYGSIPYVSGGECKYTGNTFEPADAIKGDVARIIMYMYMHYSSEIGGKTDQYTGIMKIYFVMGPNESDSFKLLRKWNAEDPVDSYEMNRNEVAFKKQGNRNPFIDHPSWADKIWG